MYVRNGTANVNASIRTTIARMTARLVESPKTVLSELGSLDQNLRVDAVVALLPVDVSVDSASVPRARRVLPGLVRRAVSARPEPRPPDFRRGIVVYRVVQTLLIPKCVAQASNAKRGNATSPA